jgi:hypothetical protein
MKESEYASNLGVGFDCAAYELVECNRKILDIAAHSSPSTTRKVWLTAEVDPPGPKGGTCRVAAPP